MSEANYVIEVDGSIHRMRFCGDCDWEENTVTSIQKIRDDVIDEFLHKAETRIYDRILQNQSRLHFASGLAVANRMLDEIAEEMKSERVINL